MSVVLLPLVLLGLFVPLLILISVAVTVVWTGAKAIRAVFRGLHWTIDQVTASPATIEPRGRLRCGRPACQAPNPPAARFCRRCGGKLGTGVG